MKDVMDIVTHNVPHHASNTATMMDIPYIEDIKTIGNRKPYIWFIGMYFLARPQIITFLDIALKDGKKIICHWIGSDISDMFKLHQSQRDIWKKYFSNPNFLHLSECDSTKKELEEMGINSEVCPLPLKRIPQYLPLPIDKLRIAIYMYGRPEFYYWSVMLEIMKKNPQYEFIVFGGLKSTENYYVRPELENVRYLGQVDITQEVIPFTNTLIRLTEHDGLPLGPIEFMIAKRFVIVNNKKLFGSIFSEPSVNKVQERLDELDLNLNSIDVEDPKLDLISNIWENLTCRATIEDLMLKLIEEKFEYDQE